MLGRVSSTGACMRVDALHGTPDSIAADRRELAQLMSKPSDCRLTVQRVASIYDIIHALRRPLLAGPRIQPSE